MRKFSKTLLSLLLVVLMIVGYVPLGTYLDSDVTKAKAAGQSGSYRWVLVSRPTVGKQYLLVNTNQATSSAKAVRIYTGTAEGGATDYAAVGTKSDGTNVYIDAFDGDIYSEFNIVRGMPASSNGAQYGSATFMFQNTGTGGYLFNDWYTNGTAAVTRVKVTYDPLHDTYPAETRIMLASNATYWQNHWCKTNNNTTITPTAMWVQFDASSSSDPSGKIMLHKAFNTSDYPCMNLIYHPNGIVANNTSRIYLNSTGFGYDQTRSFYWGTGTDNWMLITGTPQQANDGYTWNSGTSYWNAAGQIQDMRFDYVDGGTMTGTKGVWLASCIFYKNAFARLTEGSTLRLRAWYGCDGFYPSHRWLPCQFCELNCSTTPPSGCVMESAGWVSYPGLSGREWQYFYGFNSSGYFCYQYGGASGIAAGTYFYEKQYTDDTCTWELVTSLDLTQGNTADNAQEYIICNKGGSAQSGATILRMGSNSSSGVTTAGSKTVSASAYTSTVNTGDTWRIIRVGSRFYLQNVAYGRVLMLSQGNVSSGTANIATANAPSYGAEGADYVHTNYYRYNFTYTPSSHSLKGYKVAYNNNSTESENEGETSLTLGGSSTIYLYKKTFHTHTWNNGVVTTAANCVDTGVKTYTCSSCGQTKTETIPVDPNNHKGPINNTAAVAATCSAVGYTAGKQCSACHVYTQGHSQIAIDSTAHNWGNWTKISDTQHQRTCTINSSHKETANHSWNAGVVTTQPTCTTTGVRTYTCSVCNGTKTETIAKLAHTPGDWETTQAATCTATGTKVKKCTVCGTVLETETIAALGHQWGAWTAYGNDDNHRRICGRDGDHVETQAHNWVLQSGGTVATCTQVGDSVYKCSVCNQTKTVTGSLDPANHDGHLTHTAAVAATCVAAGNIEYWYCDACQKYFSNAAGTTEITQASTVIAIDANAHDWGDWTDAGASGHTRVCSRSSSHTETVAHTYPSTWSQGNDTHHTKTCTVSTCAHVLSEEHTFGDWVVVTPAQVGVDGLKRHTCTVCGKVVDETIPALTNPQMTVGTVNTTQGSTVNVDVTLTGNTGIYAQNFVIYYPKTLTLNDITFSDDVYPSTEGVVSNPLFMDPVTNARMEGYFDYANITKAGNYGAAIYVDNGALTNSTNDGRIITLSFTVPSGSSTTDYPVGIFGVYASETNGHDAIDANGDSLSMPVVYHNGSIHITNPQTECTTHTWGAWEDVTTATCTTAGEQRRVCQVCGAVEYQYVAQGSHNYVATVTAPTCTEAGYTTHVCSVCGDTYTDTPVAALGHNFGSWTTVWTASGINGQLERRTCSRCGLFEERTTGSATNSGYSTSAAGTQTYQYELTDTILPGHEYVIVNSNAAGTRKALYDNSGAQGSGNVTVSTSGGKTIVNAPNDTYVWNTYSGIYLQNKGTGDFLKAYNGTSGDNISLNLGITATSANTNDYKFNSNGYQSAGNYYLGYKDSITAVPTGVDPDDYAHPSGNKQNITGYAFTGGTDAETSGDYTMTVDVCFASAGSYATFSRWNGSALDSYTLRPTTATIKIGNVTQNAEFSYGSSSYGNHWMRFQVVAEGGKLNMYVDGVKVINNVTISTPGYAAGIITFGDGEGTVYIDNLVIESATHDVGYSFDGNRFGDGDDRSSVASGWTNNQPTATVVATNVFTASTNSNAAPRVYFYEKRPVTSGEAPSYVYQRAESVVSGETYVLVSSAIEGSANELTGNAGTANVTVYNDGVSYKPYVNTAAANEFVVTAAGTNTYIFNNTATNKFLTVNGAETALSDDCKLTVKAVKIGENQTTPDVLSVNVAGTKYFLYKKTAISRIDSDLVDDVITVTDCNGTLSNNNPVDIRGNDHWTDRTAMTIVGLISALPSGVTAGNVYYASNAAAGTMNNSLSLTNGTATLSNGNITFTAAANAAFASSEDFYYVAQVDHLGAYIYGKITIGAKPAHTLTPHAAVPATCTEAGNSAYWSCSVCGKYFSDAAGTTEIAADSWIIAATGHDYVAVVTAPTCTEAGYTTHTCSRCGDTYTDTPVAALGHDFGEWTEVTPATCTTAGSERRDCSRCDVYETREIAALGHDLTAHPAVAADCTTAGNSAYWSCSRCGKYFSDDQGTTEIAADSWIIAALGHDYVAVVTAPTCTEAGYTTHTCSRCGDTYTDTPVAALGHDFGEWTEVTPATCTTAGSERRDCSRCDVYETREIAALGHVLTAHPAVAADCTTAGNSAYWSCSRCNKYFSDDQGTTEIAADSWIIAATGHAWGAWTLVDDTNHQRVCANDASHVETEAHTWDEGVITTQATCTTAGVKTYTCSVCGGTKTEVIPAGEHTWGAWVTDYVAGGLDGHEHRTCAVCGEYEGRALGTGSGEGYSTISGDPITIYQIANSIVAGNEYIFVDRCTAGTGHILTDGQDVEVTVYSDGVSYAPYVNVSDDYDREASEALASNTLDVNGTTYYAYKKVAVTNIDTDLIDDFAVIDFGSGFDSIAIRPNDDWTDRVSVTLEGITDDLNGASTNNVFYKNNQVTYATPIALDNGSAALVNGNITFTPAANARYEEVDTIYYGVTVDHLGAHMYAAVNIIPATTVYYEDTAGFITYTNSVLHTTEGAHAGWGDWTTVGAASDIDYLFENLEADSSYGYNSGNNGNYMYSAGSVKKVTYGQENYDRWEQLPAGQWDSQFPSVEFTFKGTGVTIFSATGKSSGFITIEIVNTSTNSVVVSDIVDEYFGYTYSGGTWTPNTDAANTALYQVPILDYQLSSYGEYRVKIMVTYSEYFDPAGLGYTEFFFDGFRVYNPLGVGAGTDATAAAQYKKDGEFDPKYLNLRSSLTTDTSATGALFVDGDGLQRNIPSVTEYNDMGGATNEVMLLNGNGVSFKLTAATVPDKVAIGAKVTHGSAGQITVVSGSNSDDIAITSGTEMYYNITDLLTWTETDGGYTTDTITITNNTSGTGNHIISLTNVKISSGESKTATPTVNFAAGNERDTWEVLAEIYGVDVITGDVDGDGLLTVKDIALLKKYLAGAADLSKYDIQAADLDGNGTTSVKDLPNLRSLIAG